MHLHHPAPNVGVVYVGEPHAGLLRVALQPSQVERVQLNGALCQAFFDPHMFEVACDQRINRQMLDWLDRLGGSD